MIDYENGRMVTNANFFDNKNKNKQDIKTQRSK